MSLGPALAEGKVRSLHAAGDDHLLMVASDRISAYDAILPDPIPGKGRVLTGLSVHWFGRLADVVPNHLVGWRRSDLPEEARDDDLLGRTLLVRRLEMFPIECVVRGWLAGSGWRNYLADGAVCGHPLPAGLRQADRLPEPIFTPATKNDAGHDENISRAEAADLVGGEALAELERLSLAVYAAAAEDCAAAGIILADTKLEFGRDRDGRTTLGDEVVTPDSSRFWPASDHRPGESPPSFDKQYVRDHLDAIGWDHTPPAPRLGHEVIAGTSTRYREAFERVAGQSFDHYLEEARQ